MASMSFTTPLTISGSQSDLYSLLPDVRFNSSGRGLLAFTIKATSDVQVCLHALNNDDDDDGEIDWESLALGKTCHSGKLQAPTYELYIGGWMNRKTVLHRYAKPVCNVSACESPDAMVSSGKCQVYWIEIDDEGMFLFGTGDFLSDPLLSWHDPHEISRINVIGFSAWDSPIQIFDIHVYPVVHNRKLVLTHLDFKPLLANELYSDVTIIVNTAAEGIMRIFAHMVILARFIDNPLLLTSMNADTNERELLMEPSICGDAVMIVLKFIYVGYTFMSKESIKDVSEAARCLDMSAVVNLCKAISYRCELCNYAKIEFADMKVNILAPSCTYGISSINEESQTTPVAVKQDRNGFTLHIESSHMPSMTRLLSEEFGKQFSNVEVVGADSFVVYCHHAIFSSFTVGSLSLLIDNHGMLETSTKRITMPTVPAITLLRLLHFVYSSGRTVFFLRDRPVRYDSFSNDDVSLSSRGRCRNISDNHLHQHLFRLGSTSSSNSEGGSDLESGDEEENNVSSLSLNTDSLFTISINGAVSLLMLASQYMIFSLIRQIVAFLIKHLDVFSCCDLLHFTSVYNFPELREASLKCLANNYTFVSNTRSFQALPGEVVLAVIQRDDVKASNERDVYESVLRWNSSAPDYNNWLINILPFIKFPLFKKSYLLELLKKKGHAGYYPHDPSNMTETDTTSQCQTSVSDVERVLIIEAIQYLDSQQQPTETLNQLPDNSNSRLIRCFRDGPSLTQRCKHRQPIPLGTKLTMHNHGDENGVSSWIGTNFGTAKWTSPHSALQNGRFRVFSSSPVSRYCNPGFLVDRRFHPTNYVEGRNAFWGFDLGVGRTLIIDHYTFRHDGSSDNFAVAWSLQGSNDGVAYVDLDVVKNNRYLTYPPCLWLLPSA